MEGRRRGMGKGFLRISWVATGSRPTMARSVVTHSPSRPESMVGHDHRLES
ncbi:cytochrome c oxidase assembly protein COX11, mitochondrial-like protein [Corchorus olitorius]|uniref:Cytochrome c oxidase assembly protein COX11, mitochondrial-like protein n=1 Tax=Corchorus olitorius TaxID=93759 RepID=A0A1R3KIH0_9ROSI|nr:cytochrome c oxidase assembly protein COX11, mitochondrial-like protein [Corchorus olitorius]